MTNSKIIFTLTPDLEQYQNYSLLCSFNKFLMEKHGGTIHPLTKIQLIVEYYKFIKKYHEIENWDAQYYGRFTNISKRLLTWAGDNVFKVLDIIEFIGGKLDYNNTNWSLETIYSLIPDLSWKYDEAAKMEKWSYQEKLESQERINNQERNKKELYQSGVNDK